MDSYCEVWQCLREGWGEECIRPIGSYKNVIKQGVLGQNRWTASKGLLSLYHQKGSGSSDQEAKGSHPSQQKFTFLCSVSISQSVSDPEPKEWKPAPSKKGTVTLCHFPWPFIQRYLQPFIQLMVLWAERNVSHCQISWTQGPSLCCYPGTRNVTLAFCGV